MFYSLWAHDFFLWSTSPGVIGDHVSHMAVLLIRYLESVIEIYAGTYLILTS